MIRLLLLGCALASWSSALAAEQGNLRRFTPSPVLSPYFTLDGSRGHGQGGLAASFVTSYEARPLIFAKEGERTTDIIRSRLSGDLSIAYGVFDWLDVGLGAPVVLSQEGRTVERAETLQSFAFGDPSLGAKAALLDPWRDGFGLAAISRLTLPLGDATAFVGEPNASFSLGLAGELALSSQVDVAANLGYRLREATQIDAIVIDDEITWGLGGSVRLRHFLALVAEVNGALSASDPLANPGESPVDLDLGLRYHLWESLQVVGGAGAGLAPGYGSPAWRVFLGFEVVPRRHDFDADLVVDGRDACVDVPGEVSLRGCPGEVVAEAPPEPGVLDTDQDGVADGADRCPRLPEDKDGFRDADGCPDPDNDLDFVADAQDADGLAPEDWDGFEDEDGAPDLDNDADGIADYKDRCPMVAGAVDGCPGTVAARQSAPPKQAARAARPPSAETLLRPKKPIVFRVAKPGLTRAGKRQVKGLARLLKAHPEYARVEVGVHTDARGRLPWKMKLSQARARAVLGALVDAGVAPTALAVAGFDAIVESLAGTI